MVLFSKADPYPGYFKSKITLSVSLYVRTPNLRDNRLRIRFIFIISGSESSSEPTNVICNFSPSFLYIDIYRKKLFYSKNILY